MQHCSTPEGTLKYMGLILKTAENYTSTVGFEAIIPVLMLEENVKSKRYNPSVRSINDK